MQVALTSILPRSDLIARCDDVRSRALKFGAAREDPHEYARVYIIKPDNL